MKLCIETGLRIRGGHVGWGGEGGMSSSSIGGKEAAGREAGEEDERWGRRGARKMTGWSTQGRRWGWGHALP